MVDIRKTQLSVFIGFLFLILLGIIFYIFRAAAQGEAVARWVLFLIFGTTAVVLVSFGIGYVILLLTKPGESGVLQRGSTVSYQRTARHQQPGMWIDLAQLPSYIASQKPVHKKPAKKEPNKRVVKKRR